MKFYDRKEEMKILERNRRMSQKRGTFTVITGRRRIGKTALIRESERENVLYFFVPRVNEKILCQQLVNDARTGLGISLIDSGKFRDLFEQLMIYGEKDNFTFVIDEFQELERIDRSIMSSIQGLWDEYAPRSKVNLIVSGSVQSMMIKIFEMNKEPLFGRATSKMNIGPFTPGVLKEILRDHNPNYKNEDLLFLYSVTGGIPKYVELFMDSDSTTFEKMLDSVCSMDSYFLTDGKDLLISEFGKDHRTYFSILQLIANGKNTLSEINDRTGKDCGAYLDNLEKEYRLIRKNRPMFSKENSRDIRWQVSDNYLRFYFKFINTNLSAVEFRRFDLLKESIREGYEQYSGKVLEDYFKEKSAEEERFTSVGSYWDKKGQNEIDVIVLDEHKKKAIVAEVKRNPKKAGIKDLIEKTEAVQALKGYEKEYKVLSIEDM